MTPMTQLFEHAISAARNLPPTAQDDIARLVLRLSGSDDAVEALLPDEQRAIALSKAAATRGEFATDAQVQSVWAKHGL